jgi:16S rRNA (adenine1518-N6/adenine1519-N6)-dimethyltransferase
VVARIAKVACEEGEELVVEIGPGKGVLTRHLLARARRVVAIEIDAALASRLEPDSRLTVLHADVLNTDLAQWGPCVLAGNLPYYITSPILDRIFRAAEAIRMATLMVQEEVAQRLTADPGSRAYGYLTVRTLLHSDPRLLFPVSPAAFQPPPKVSSAVVQLRMKPPEAGSAALLEFVSQCFTHKRKTLRNNLSSRYPKALLDAQPEANLRAEQLSVDAFRELYARLVATSDPLQFG